ncbi:hypothetical protein [Methanosphaera sp. WGK6]|uniref:hypothetical protein n=1 Tax=Methanosphaera sp. WGK6 TaxID=1561964 RepID=UPI00130192F7|nr:hypothetical protein [Methanosphaera sp. WGK6]
MKNKLRTSHKIQKDPEYLFKEKRIIKTIFSILLIIAVFIVVINLINYIPLLFSKIST